GEGAAGYGGAQNTVGNVNPGQARQIRCYNYNGGQDNAIDEDVDEKPAHDLALNVDNMFQADDCDAFDSNVDETPMAQTMFMVNLSSADPVYDKAGPSYDLDILSEYVKENTVPGVQSARATGVDLGIKLIWNSTWRTEGRPGRSSGKKFRNSLTNGFEA
nr:hypothetical protein [Tanacetum cinerariifolium]